MELNIRSILALTKATDYFPGKLRVAVGNVNSVDNGPSSKSPFLELFDLRTLKLVVPVELMQDSLNIL